MYGEDDVEMICLVHILLLVKSMDCREYRSRLQATINLGLYNANL